MCVGVILAIRLRSCPTATSTGLRGNPSAGLAWPFGVPFAASEHDTDLRDTLQQSLGSADALERELGGGMSRSCVGDAGADDAVKRSR